MSPRLARALALSERARQQRERMAAAGRCPTCWLPIPGLEPVESRPRPWRYCDDCRAGDRDRKREMRKEAA